MATIAIAIVLLISIVTDVRHRKILNLVTLPASLTGFLFHIVTSGFNGFYFSGLGFLVGLGLLIIPFIMGGIGAGDVKLLAAIGAWKGAAFVFYTTLYGAVIGGVIALFVILKRKRLKHTLFSFRILNNPKALQELGETYGSVSIPYAVPLAIGAIIAFVVEAFM